MKPELKCTPCEVRLEGSWFTGLVLQPDFMMMAHVGLARVSSLPGLKMIRIYDDGDGN